MPDTLPLSPEAPPALDPSGRSARDPAVEPLLLLSAKQAAAACGVSPATWYRRVSDGTAPAPLRIGGRVLWRRAELVAWTQAGCPPRREWEALQTGGNGRK